MHFLFGIITVLAAVRGITCQLVNGQFFTQGLSISNSPAPNGQHTVGGNIPISVDISGNGRIPQSASIPGSTLPTAFLSLNIYLISSQTNVNITVSEGTQFLAGEQGSTVKHLTWPIPGCLPGGEYNFTYYERSRINYEEYFAITPIPITILHPSSFPEAESATCDGALDPQPQPQLSNPIKENPLRNPSLPLLTDSATPTSVVEAGATEVVITASARFSTSAIQVNDKITATSTRTQTLGPTNKATDVVMGMSYEDDHDGDDRILVPVNGAIGFVCHNLSDFWRLSLPMVLVLFLVHSFFECG